MAPTCAARASLGLAAALLTLAGGPGPKAETLAEAIASAYQTNPRLQAQRAQQQVIDEGYVQARAGLRPTLGVSASTTYSNTGLPHGGKLETNSGAATLTGAQPIYTGGRVSSAVRAAEAAILAGREALRAAEADLILHVVGAYSDVLLNQQVVRIRQAAIADLERRRFEAATKFQIGQVTRTDLAQAETQLAQARAFLSLAQSQLQNTAAAYTQVVGHAPADLAPEPDLPGVPADIDTAFATAEAESPLLGQARFSEQGSRARIAEARAAGRPSVSLQASLGYSGPAAPFSPRDYTRDVTGEVLLTQPLFSGGVIASGVRAALARNTVDRLSIEDTRRNVVLAVSQAWNNMQALRSNVSISREQLRAARIAFAGIQEEYHLGLRTTLDVLLQQQTLSTAELALAQAQHDYYVAQAMLLSATGRLQVDRLVNGLPPYDPAESFGKIRSAGVLPWDGLVGALDSIGAPKAQPLGTVPLPKPVAGPVTMNAPATGQP